MQDDVFCVDGVDAPKEKRSRSSNFTSQEEDVLMSLVEKYSHIVENKKTNAVTWQQKNEAWEKISIEFASQCNNIRSSKNLRDKYDNMKRKAKTSISSDRNQLYKTGGGPYCSKVSHNDERIHALLGKAATGIYNEYDCDTNNNQKQNEESMDEIEFLEGEFQIEIEEKNKTSHTLKENTEKSSSWRNWNPTKLKTKRAEKLNLKNRVVDNNENLLAKQAIFFENEDKRAEERHKLQIKELALKIEILQWNNYKLLLRNPTENFEKHC